MGTKRSPKLKKRIEEAVEELRSMIQARYPDAKFDVYEGEDPEGTYLAPIVDFEDSYEVLEVVMDRMLDMEVEEGLPVYVVPVRPLERSLEQLRREA